MRRYPHLLVLLGLSACGMQAADQAPGFPASESKAMEMEELAEEDEMPSPRSPKKARRSSRADSPAPAAVPTEAAAAFGSGSTAMDDGIVSQSDKEGERKGSGAKDMAAAAEAPKTRAWFPETFLFEPLVVTDSAGKASITTTIPDRLTTWRVLALAHSRDGALGGAVARLPGRLPVYVDPVVPPFLRAGDTINLPIQAVNTTDTLQNVALTVSSEGGTLSGGREQLSLPTGGGSMSAVTLSTPRAGMVKVRAEIRGEGAGDDVVREIPVEAIGRPVERSAAGTLGAPRTVTLEAPGSAQATDHRIRLVVVPGALAIVENELLASASRLGRSAAHVAHGLRLAADGPAVLESLGAPVRNDGDDPEARARGKALRDLRMLATQEALLLSRSTTLDTALQLGPGAARHNGDALLTGLADRMLSWMADNQRPDGTFGGSTDGTWTMQRVIAATAEGATAARQILDAPASDGVREQRSVLAKQILVRAAGALERSAPRIADPYTAALALQTGVLEPETAAGLRALIQAAAVSSPSGGATVPVPVDVVRADGQRPGTLDLTALSALALSGSPDHADLTSELSAAVLSAWRPGRGWGDGVADVHALTVVTELLGSAPPETLRLTLRQGETVIAEETLDARSLRSVHVLERSLDGVQGGGDWTITSTPPMPGLGYSLTHTARDPWTHPPTTAGLELEQTPPTGLRVGHTSELKVALGTTAGLSVDVEIALPAGVQIDAAALDKRKGSVIEAWTANDASLTLTVRADARTGMAKVSVPVVPTLAGELSSGPTVLRRSDGRGGETILAPTVWRIR